jgi:transposase
MLDVNPLQAGDLQGLSKSAVIELALRLLAAKDEQINIKDERLAEQDGRLAAKDGELAAKVQALAAKDEELARRDRELKFRQAKIERITFELARLKAWKFGAKSEAMNAEQRQMFDDTLAEDVADLEAQLQALQGDAEMAKPQADAKRKPRRQALPEHLRRVEHHHEPESTTCTCGEAMVRIGEDVSERLDIVPAEFFVHRHIRGKWACKCCQQKGEGRLVQEPVDPQIIDKGVPTAGLIAHTLVARFVDHLPYFRQEQINARSGVHTPRSTLASWAGAGGASLMPLYEAHGAFVLSASVVHADETPVRMLEPGAGKTAKAYVWAYARGEHDGTPGVIYDFCRGRGSKYPADFLAEWSGTLTCDDYGGYDVVFKREGCIEAGCLAHARRKFDELAKANASPVAAEAIVRIARLYRVESLGREMTREQRLTHRQQHARPLWDELHGWMTLERARVPDGGGIAAALDYSLKRWSALGRFLSDGAVSVDNNHIENLMRPWALGRKSWLFAGSELAGKRAAVVMSLVQSAKLRGHDPWVYLKDVLERLLAHPNHRIDELLPHRWTLAT